MTKQPLAKGLTYAGILPFLACALLAWVTDEVPYLSISLSHVILAYGAVIASFIAGIHWGIYLFKDSPVNLFVHSNVVALIAWLCLLIPTGIATIGLIVCFGYLLYIDRENHRAGVIEAWFFKLRIHASIAVVTSLIIFLLSQLT